jgi:predicted PhzF superfamily epimerase YddE/YHI9
MSDVHELHVLRVFCDEQGRGGNLLGVFPASRDLPLSARQPIAKRLGFSETVFVDDPRRGILSIFTPTTELPFAGHPLVGAAWLLRQGDRSLAVLWPPAGEVQIAEQEGLTWVYAEPEYSPPWARRQLPDRDAVLALEGPPENLGHVQVWAFIDERRGVIRARVFARDYGVSEDPATGSAAIALCASLKRELRIIQGRAGHESEIHARPLADGRVAVGGRIVSDRPPESYSLARVS